MVFAGTSRRGHRVIVISLRDLPLEMLEELNVEQHREVLYKLQIRQIVTMFTRMLSDPHAQIMGVAMAEDWEGHPPFKLMMKLDGIQTSKQKKEVFALFQGVVPIRWTGFYMLNQPKWINVLLALAKPFMGKKLRERIYLLKDDWPRLHALIAPEELPESFGGAWANGDVSVSYPFLLGLRLESARILAFPSHGGDAPCAMCLSEQGAKTGQRFARGSRRRGRTANGRSTTRPSRSSVRRNTLCSFFQFSPNFPMKKIGLYRQAWGNRTGDWRKPERFSHAGICAERAGCSDKDPPPYEKEDVPCAVQ
jgi:hypothetical protein